MTLRAATYVDPEGRSWRRLLPEGESDDNAELGVPGGPPPLERLGLPLALEVRLHNELFNRGLFTESDLRGRLGEVRAALMAALKLDAQAVEACYAALTPDAVAT